MLFFFRTLLIFRLFVVFITIHTPVFTVNRLCIVKQYPHCRRVGIVVLSAFYRPYKGAQKAPGYNYSHYNKYNDYGHFISLFKFLNGLMAANLNFFLYNH